MKNLIAILAVSISWAATAQTSWSKKDTLRFAPDSTYSRALLRNGQELVFATSNNGVIAMNEKTSTTRTLLLPSPSGEFRDVALYKDYVIGMIAGDNGEIWLQQGNYRSLKVEQPGLFFDAIDHLGDVGIVLADPKEGHFQLLLYTVTGKSLYIRGPEAIDDEAAYAASGSTIAFIDSAIVFISGGKSATRIHRSADLGKTWQSSYLPMQQGEGCGPFSLHAITDEHLLIVGGCYTQPGNPGQSSLYSTDGGKTWQVSATTTNGYRSCVTGTEKRQFACGSNGIDVSTDGGRNWKAFDKGNFCALLLEKKYLYATTNKGYCIRYKLK